MQEDMLYNRQIAADITTFCVPILQGETAPRWHQSKTRVGVLGTMAEYLLSLT